MISTVVKRTLRPHPHLAPPLSTYDITLLYTHLSFLSNASHKTPPHTRRACGGTKAWVSCRVLRRAIVACLVAQLSHAAERHTSGANLRKRAVRGTMQHQIGAGGLER